jgi:cytidine deaminase
MGFRALAPSDKDLLKRTVALLRERRSEVSGVSAGLRTSTGREFYGLSIDPRPATVGICAEYSAIGAMVTSGEKRIDTIVAVTIGEGGKQTVLPPCGKCRDFIRGFGDPFVIVPGSGSEPRPRRTVLSELVPLPWDASFRSRSDSHK